jgi:hypothetical protein
MLPDKFQMLTEMLTFSNQKAQLKEFETENHAISFIKEIQAN